MRRVHIDIALTEEQDRELKEKAKERGMCKTEYARMKLFSQELIQPGKDKQREDILTLKEFAKMVHISVSSARLLCKENRIEHYRFGKSIRIRAEEIEKFKSKEEASREEDDMKCFFSTKQAANFLVVTKQTIGMWIRKGDLSARLVKGRYLIPKEELDRFVLQQKSNTASVH